MPQQQTILRSEKWQSKLARVINSAVCFSVAYILLTEAYWFITALAARMLGFNSFFYYYGIKFMLNNKHWDKWKITFVYSAAPLACLLIGLIAIYVFRKIKSLQLLLNLLLVWIFVVGTSMFVAQIVVALIGTNNFDSPFYEGWAVVFSWRETPLFLIYFLIIPFIILFFYFSANYAGPFLLFTYSFSKVNKTNRKRKYLFETAIVPFLIGAVGTTMLTMPVNLNIHILYLSTIGSSLLVGGYLLNLVEVHREQILRYKFLQKLNIPYLVLLAFLCEFIVLTFKGIYF